MQSIRTALRTGGRFLYKSHYVERCDGAVEGPADVWCLQLRTNGTQQVAKRLSGPRSALLEDLLEVREAILDPLDRWRPEDLLSAAAERVDVFVESLDATLGLDQSLGERLAPAALADEVDKVGQPALLGRELGFLQVQRVREVRAQLGDLLFDALQDVRDVLRI